MAHPRNATCRSTVHWRLHSYVRWSLLRTRRVVCRGSGSKWRLFVFGLYMYRYAPEGRIYVHIFTYTYIQIYTDICEVRWSCFCSWWFCAPKLCSFHSKTTAVGHVYLFRLLSAVFSIPIHPGDLYQETSNSQSSHVFVYTVTECSAPSQCS